MTYKVYVLADSIGKTHGIRITTLSVTFPRFILAEFNTHRMLSRNAASSRAIPTSKIINQVETDPFIPEKWGANQRGMTATREIKTEDTKKASAYWLEARDYAVRTAEELFKLGVHKQLANRLLEPFMWTTVVVTATNWDNFLHLRTRTDAQPEFRKIAMLIRRTLANSVPVPLNPDEWHLPYIDSVERDTLGQFTAATVSAARCARVSYLTHEGVRDTSKDIELADKLLNNGHMSPFEHPAQCMNVATTIGNFTGWLQYRKTIPNEHDPLGERNGT